MQKAGIKRIPIVDDTKLLGVLSRADIVRAFARSDSEIINECREHVISDVLWIDPR